MKKHFFFLISLFTGLILLVISFKKIGLENILLAVSSISILKFAIVLGISFLWMFVASLRWKIIIETQNSTGVSFFKVFKAKLVGFTVSYLTPVIFVGGEPFRAYLLKKETKIPLNKAVSSIIIDSAIYLTVVFFFFIIGLIFFLNFFIPPRNFLFVIAIFLIFNMVVFYIFYSKALNKTSKNKGAISFLIGILSLNKIKAIQKIENEINNTEEDISNFFKHQKRKLVITFSLTVLEVLLTLFVYWLVIYFLGYTADIKQIFSINTLIIFIFLVPIPAAIGSFEMSQLFIFPFLGISSTIGIVFSLIIRMINLIMAGLGIVFLGHFQYNLYSERFKKIIKKLIKKFEKSF